MLPPKSTFILKISLNYLKWTWMGQLYRWKSVRSCPNFIILSELFHFFFFFFFLHIFFRPSSLQNGSLPEPKFVRSITPNEDEIDSLSFPTNLPEIASIPKKIKIWPIYVFGETISIKYDQMATMNINGEYINTLSLKMRDNYELIQFVTRK